MKWTNGACSALLVGVALAACTAVPAPQAPVTVTRTIDTSCDLFKPIYPSCSDVVADTTARQIVEHNQVGAAHCGWKPPTGSRCNAPPGK